MKLLKRLLRRAEQHRSGVLLFAILAVVAVSAFVFLLANTQKVFADDPPMSSTMPPTSTTTIPVTSSTFVSSSTSSSTSLSSTSSTSTSSSTSSSSTSSTTISSTTTTTLQQCAINYGYPYCYDTTTCPAGKVCYTDSDGQGCGCRDDLLEDCKDINPTAFACSFDGNEVIHGHFIGKTSNGQFCCAGDDNVYDDTCKNFNDHYIGVLNGPCPNDMRVKQKIKIGYGEIWCCDPNFDEPVENGLCPDDWKMQLDECAEGENQKIVFDDGNWRYCCHYDACKEYEGSKWNQLTNEEKALICRLCYNKEDEMGHHYDYNDVCGGGCCDRPFSNGCFEGSSSWECDAYHGVWRLNMECKKTGDNWMCAFT